MKSKSVSGANPAPASNGNHALQNAATKQSALCVLIFLVIILAFVLLESYSSAKLTDNDALSYVIYFAYLFSPLFGCIAARIATKEGFRDGILWPRFTGNAKAYLLAIGLPVFMGLMGGILCTLVLKGGLSIKIEGGFRMALLSILLLFAQAYYAIFLVAGEELGWRALLYDKLEIILGTNGSIIVGGIIWGLWHFPGLCYGGINFGKDYPGFPFVGILLMSISTIFMGAILQLLRKMSGSVIPACVFHGLFDSVCAGFVALFTSAEQMQSHLFTIGICSLLVPSVIAGIPCWIILVKKSPSNGLR